MKTNGIKLGDVVRLKSGGPDMTVISIDVHELLTYARCTWFDENMVQQSSVLIVEALSVVSS